MTPQVSAQEATQTYTCGFPGCTAEVKSKSGKASRCPTHRVHGVARAPLSGVLGQIEGLKDLAKAIDKAEAKARALAVKSAEARAEAKKLKQDLAAKMREMAGAA